jgi:hypothetical protein
VRGTVRDERRWALVEALLKLNPGVTHARIGRAVGYKGQNVGVIAKALGLPPRAPGGFQKRDDTPLIWPPGYPESEPKASQEAPGEPTEAREERVEADGV